MTNETELSRLKQKLLLRDRPLRKAGLIRWLLPEIDRALQNGYSIVELHAALTQAGIKLHYKLLTAYIRRARAEKKKQSAASPAALPTPREQPPSPSARRRARRGEIRPAVEFLRHGVEDDHVQIHAANACR